MRINALVPLDLLRNLCNYVRILVNGALLKEELLSPVRGKIIKFPIPFNRNNPTLTVDILLTDSIYVKLFRKSKLINDVAP